MSEITKPILLDETGRRIADALGLIAIAQAGSAANIKSWESVQQIVRNGLGPKAFPVGARLTSAHSSYTSIEWDVVAHNQHKKPGDDSAPTMTLLMHACIYGRMIDASEMLWANTGESALPAGTYNFTLYKGGNGGYRREGAPRTQSAPVQKAEPKEEAPKDMYNLEYSRNFKRTGGGKMRSFGEKKRTF